MAAPASNINQITAAPDVRGVLTVIVTTAGWHHEHAGDVALKLTAHGPLLVCRRCGGVIAS